MTNEEAEAWAIRLTQIWAPEYLVVAPKWKFEEDRFCFRFNCEVSPDTFMEGRIFSKEPAIRLVSESHELIYGCGEIEMSYIARPVLFEKLIQFAEEWMPFFRRNCYLSGCEIECTGHEQLEWAKWLQERKALGLEKRLLMD